VLALLATHDFASWSVEPSFSSFVKSRSTISQRWVDPFQGDACTPPVAYFYLFCALYVCATYQPCGPHLMDVTRVRTSPRCSTLLDFSDQGETPSPSETPIHDVVRRQISWLSFLLDRWFRSNHDFMIQGFEVQRTPPPSSRYPS
jgi:hypothetical protein